MFSALVCDCKIYGDALKIYWDALNIINLKTVHAKAERGLRLEARKPRRLEKNQHADGYEINSFQPVKSLEVQNLFDRINRNK